MLDCPLFDVYLIYTTFCQFAILFRQLINICTLIICLGCWPGEQKAPAYIPTVVTDIKK